MRGNVPTLAMLFFGALAACSPSDSTQAAQSGPCMLSAEDVSLIRIMEARHEEQAATQDLEPMAEDMADDIVIWAPNEPEVVGKAQVREWQRAWEGVSFESYDLSVDEILGCGDLAVVKGSYSMVVTMPGAPEPMSDSGRWIHVLRKTPEGKWVVIRDIFNSELPLAPIG